MPWSQAKWRKWRAPARAAVTLHEVAREQEGRWKRTSARMTVSEHARGVIRKRGKAVHRSACCV
eukprot:3513283-Pleurochrysis_carterae.AAC.1